MQAYRFVDIFRNNFIISLLTPAKSYKKYKDRAYTKIPCYKVDSSVYLTI